MALSRPFGARKSMAIFQHCLERWIVLLLLITVLTSVLADAGILFSCSFDKDMCGMSNQIGSRAYWTRSYLHLGGKNGFAMAVKGNEARNHFARLVTPEFETKGSTRGCLSFRYFIDGLTPASLACIKQGFVTQYVFTTAKKTQDHWEQAQVDVDFLGDKVMFYFEADTKVQDYGNSIVAFTDVQVTNRGCRSQYLSTRNRPRH